MKIRQGFVSNSSSSSFVIITAGDTVLLEDGDTSMETCGWASINVDDLITQLQAAKEAGVKVIDITHGGGYEG